MGNDRFRFFILLLIMVALVGCKGHSWNNPHRSVDQTKRLFYSSFGEPPKTLDPARSYSSNETLFTAQVYEPPLQYHYLKRPYTLVPLSASRMPDVHYYDKNGKQLSDSAPAGNVAYTDYIIRIKPGIRYAPHPAFAKDNQGKFYYLGLRPKEIERIRTLSDLPHTGTRELVADDYVYQIKRLADPRLNSPILSLMERHIVGLKAFARRLQGIYRSQVKEEEQDFFLDLRKYPLAGVKTLGRYTYRIRINGKYPQFLYWLAMPFFAPIPWEADAFYSQPEMAENNLTFDWHPVGTGPYMLTENNPNNRMVLTRNPNFHGERYPNGEDLSGLPLPLIDQYIFALEKESIPRWSKFLQGYYDRSGVTSDSFDQAIQIDRNGNPQLTEMLKKRGIILQTTISPSIYYYGFNMLDDIVGGSSERARKLRQAISIALDQEEFISIFLNGRGIPAHGPIPPGIAGHPGDINTYIYQRQNGAVKRLPIAYAKQLLAEAGYPNGRDAKSGKPLVINYDVPMTSSAEDKARFDWMRKQFAKLDIQLNIRATLYNRFQEKMRTGNAQMFSWGWLADYPDPENFLFLLYGANGRVKFGGENAANYTNPEYDRLFEKVRGMSRGPARDEVIRQMMAMIRYDAPWIWGFHPRDYLLLHAWNHPSKINAMANNSLKYQQIDPALRTKLRAEWNRPIWWPVIALLALFVLALVPVLIKFWISERAERC